MAEGKKKKGGFELFTPLGIVLGFAMLIFVMLLSGDWQFDAVMAFVDAPSILVVFGGAATGLLVAFRPKEFGTAFKEGAAILNRKQEDLEALTEVFVEFSKKVRLRGLLALEEDLETIDDPFIKQGIELILAGSSPEEVKGILMNKIDVEIDRLSVAPTFYQKLGEYGPGFAMLGTFIGLVLMLGNLDDVSTLGPSMAVALITTLYGSIVSNLIGGPIANKLKRSINTMYSEKVFIVEAICELGKNPTPSKFKMKLESYIPAQGGKKKGKGAKEDKAA